MDLRPKNMASSVPSAGEFCHRNWLTRVSVKANAFFLLIVCTIFCSIGGGTVCVE